MEKYLKEYIQELEMLTEVWNQTAPKAEQRSEIKANILTKISFFQHERFIHLVVTVTFALLTVLSLILCFLCDSLFIFVLPILFLILLIPYVRHYYILENGVQKLYHLYDRLP